MSLDFEDFDSGGMTLHNPFLKRRHVPYEYYKRSSEFRQNQQAKPMYPSRDPAKSELRVWETELGHVNEVGGQRIYIGSCQSCDDVVLAVRDVSGHEFRGRGNPGHRGRWPVLCGVCRDRRRNESIERRRDAKRRSDRERVAERRADRRFAAIDEAQAAPWVDGYWYIDANGEEQWMPAKRID